MLANEGERNGVRVMRKASARRLMTPYQPQAPLQPALSRFGHYAPGSVAQALGGITRLDDRSGPGSAGEYAWGGAASTGFWATPDLGVSVTVMTQRMPASVQPARDALRPLIYAVLRNL
jgi:CubicO group peptidase (beta-lactamase class C family)